MMVMNNIGQLFGSLATFPRSDKFHKRIDDCMENISNGLPGGDEEVQYIINLKAKINDLITAIKSR